VKVQDCEQQQPLIRQECNIAIRVQIHLPITAMQVNSGESFGSN
jgi:hypothetical protein